MNRAEAYAIVSEYVKNENLIRNMLAVRPPCASMPGPNGALYGANYGGVTMLRDGK